MLYTNHGVSILTIGTYSKSLIEVHMLFLDVPYFTAFEFLPSELKSIFILLKAIS